jgi:hypothetical protein
VASPDPIAAGWAERRVQALANDARQLERSALEEARRRWLQVSCLDPGNHAAQAGLFRTGRFRIAGPLEVRVMALPSVSTPPPNLTRLPPPPALRPPRKPVEVAEPLVEEVPGEEEPLSRELADIDQQIGEIERLVREAHFRTALSVAGSTRELLDGEGSALAARRARLEVLAATAEVALGDREAALASMQRALRSDPLLVLEVATTSPKVVAILEAARGGSRESAAVAGGEGGAALP